MAVSREFDLAGKTFVVVGAGRGIGRGIVEVLMEAGCNGAAVSLTPTYLIPAVKKIMKEYGGKVIAIPADATKTSDMDAVFEQVIKEFGKIDIWVNAVGESIAAPLVPLPQPDGRKPPTAALTDEHFRHILDLNLVSIHAGCRAVGAYFVSQRRGRIINIGSVFARFAGMGYSTYVAAKAGVEGLTRALALEWAEFGITVNCIAPGVFPDPDFLSQEEMAHRQSLLAESVPLRRFGTLREMGLLVAFLASDGAGYMTGQTLGLDGGMNLGRV